MGRFSDGATAKTQEDQIMSIFPIVQGQKPDRRMEIPPRSSFSGSRSSSIIGREYETHHASSGNEVTEWLNQEAHMQDNNKADAALYEIDLSKSSFPQVFSCHIIITSGKERLSAM